MWINLAQVQVVMPSKYEAKAVRETLIRNKVTENLRKITVQIDEFWVRENKKPSSVSEAFGITNGYIPLTVEDGEDYSALDISGDRPLTIKTKSGYEIRYTRKNP